MIQGLTDMKTQTGREHVRLLLLSAASTPEEAFCGEDSCSKIEQQSQRGESTRIIWYRWSRGPSVCAHYTDPNKPHIITQGPEEEDRDVKWGCTDAVFVSADRCWLVRLKLRSAPPVSSLSVGRLVF